MSTSNYFSSRLFLVAVLVAQFFQSTEAAESVLVQGKDKVVTVQDVLNESLRIPPDSRATVLADPAAVARIAGNLYVRRVMADQAQAAGIEADPVVANALQIARERVLSDAWLAKIDRENAPSNDTLEKLARGNYLVKKERFKEEEKIHVRHILISGEDSTARIQVQEILTKLRSGADFAQLAKENSADPKSAIKGGDLGFLGRDVTVPEFEAAAFSLSKIGDLSDIVKTKFGYHIIKLEGRRNAGIQSFEEVKNQLMNEARDTVQQNARAGMAQRIEESAKINQPAVIEFSAQQKK